MKKLFSIIVTIAVALQIGLAQKSDKALTPIREHQQAAADWKKEAASTTSLLSPADFNDTASFGKNAKFLGSLYAGTLYVFRSCDPQILLDEYELTLAPDDHCIVHNATTPMTTTTVFNPVWQITIPANSVDNVIYPMLNNTVGYDAAPGLLPTGNGYGAGFASMRFTPIVIIESTALNDPAAIDPNTGLPMNGSYTVSLAGTRVKGFMVQENDFFSENDSYASVAGRGLSRVYFAGLGLPQNVINNLFKRSMTLKFGIRADVNGPMQQAFFSYTFRLLGN
jgi:hypothetical protein